MKLLSAVLLLLSAACGPNLPRALPCPSVPFCNMPQMAPGCINRQVVTCDEWFGYYTPTDPPEPCICSQ